MVMITFRKTCDLILRALPSDVLHHNHQPDEEEEDDDVPLLTLSLQGLKRLLQLLLSDLLQVRQLLNLGKITMMMITMIKTRILKDLIPKITNK